MVETTLLRHAMSSLSNRSVFSDKENDRKINLLNKMFLTRDKDLSFATIPFAKIPSNARLCFEHERKAARP